MNRGETPKTETRRLSVSVTKKPKALEELCTLDDDHSKKHILEGWDVQAPAIHTKDLNKPPTGFQKPELTSCERKTSPAVRATEARPVNPGWDSQLQDNKGLKGFRFDEQGMLLPHSILGSLEDFRSYLEAKGETDLVKRIPKSLSDSPHEATRRHRSEAVQREMASGQRHIQSNALQNWDQHMRHRRRQQSFLSDLLTRPVENLVMNQANHFRESQEQRELLNQVMPLIHSGYGHHVGSEFWSLPQRYGDEMSGITATLTLTEQGRRKPVTHVGQPNSIRQESGITSAETVRPASQTWDRSGYLQHECQELREVLQDMDIKKPDISGLEVIGTYVAMCRSPLPEKEEEEKEHKEVKKESLDPPSQYEDVQLDALLVPALRFCGQLARWTGNSTNNQGEAGISATIVFEAPTGQIASSHLELHNEGSAAIFYSWQQLSVPRSFPIRRSQTKNFYFNSSSGVIRPGDTQRLEFIFKSEEPGIKTELWQLNTHPVLLQGASMQVTLRGVALYQDKTADQRLFIETKLEKIVVVKMCRSIVSGLLQGVHTPERPSSPAGLYITKEQQFLSKNPKLQYLDQPVENLKRLWQQVNPGRTWDLSVDTLRQAVLSLPDDEESAQDSLNREESLAQLNSLLLPLSEPRERKHHRLTAATIGQQLWRKLLDRMDDEATGFRNLLGLPERETWLDEKDESIIPDTDEQSEKRGGAAGKEEKSGLKSRLKDDKKGRPKSPTAEKTVEENRNKGRRRDETGKISREKNRKESVSLSDTRSESISEQPPDRNIDPEVKIIYTKLLHKKVYALMEDLVNNLCDLMDDKHHPHTLLPHERNTYNQM